MTSLDLYSSFELWTDSSLQANLHIGSGTFPVFHNVRTLLLKNCDLSDNCDILGCFMNNAPCLEKLTLETCKVIFIFLHLLRLIYSSFTILQFG